MVKPLCGNKKPVLFIKTKDFSNESADIIINYFENKDLDKLNLRLL